MATVFTLRKKCLLLFSFLFCFQTFIFSQEWAWMKGSDLPDQTGVYGMQGVEDAANSPGARNGANMWAGDDLNLWIHGGYGADEDGNLGSFNDLWRYNIATNNWTWMRGTDSLNSEGVYGVQGVSDPANVPAARMRSSTWTDEEGNLWLFGGLYVSFGRYADLWKYDAASNEWTWMHGADTLDAASNYGTMGVSDPNNAPGARHAALTWKDLDGNFWIYGGFGYATDPDLGSWLSDLWRYDVSSNEWTWVSGADTVNAPVVYGELGVPNADAQPGGRGSSVSWTDQAGDLWLFGGVGTGRRNDLWKYNIASNQWTWVKGSDQIDQSGTTNIDDPTMPLPEDTPGARNGHAGAVDLNGHLWFFGGWGSPAFTEEQGFLNDTWRYEISSDLWYFVNGTLGISNDPGNFGTQGQPDPNNAPPAVASPASVIDIEGNIWMFGGNNSNIRQNALWKLSGGNLVDVQDLDQQSSVPLEVFPNPAGEILYLSLSKAELLDDQSLIKVVDALGRTVMQERFVDNLQELNLSQLSSGSYILIIQINDKLYSKRVIKQ